MLHHLLFVTCSAQADNIKAALERLRAERLSTASDISEAFQLKHPLLGTLVLNIHVITNLDAITPHVRAHPVDLLIYDERGGNEPTPSAIRRIKKDVEALSEHWGPDFLFPMSRVVAILEHEEQESHRAFELGRLQVRDVCANPKSTATILRWLKRILEQGVIRDRRVGLALSGGGLEGFLYQIGVLYALEQALGKDAVKKIDVFAGVSSGAIASSLCAGDVPVSEVIRAMHGKSDIMEKLKGSMLFDFAASDIGKRILSEATSWAGLDPHKWVNKVLQAVPTGLFKGSALKEYFRKTISAYAREDSFAALRAKLFVGATDQDTFEHITFGEPPWDDIPVSEALRASCALPPFFTPVRLKGRWFIDGQVTSACDLERLVENDCRLIFVIDPLRPMTTPIPGTVDKRGGIYAMIQTIKALIYSRFHNAITHVNSRYPDIDFLVFQPDEECAELMAGSPMRYRIRPEITQAAFKQTLRQLRERHHLYYAKLARFGFELKPSEELIRIEDNNIIKPDSVA